MFGDPTGSTKTSVATSRPCSEMLVLTVNPLAAIKKKGKEQEKMIGNEIGEAVGK